MYLNSFSKHLFSQRVQIGLIDIILFNHYCQTVNEQLKKLIRKRWLNLTTLNVLYSLQNMLRFMTLKKVF